MHAGSLESMKDAQELHKAIAECNSSFLSALQTSQVHKLDIRTATSMSKFFYNIADKNACFVINWKILVTRATEKQTLLLAGYKDATIA